MNTNDIDTNHINKYLSMKRFFIFLDEWLSYLLLFILYYMEYYVIFGIAVVLAVIFNGYGYLSYWKVEEKYNDFLVNQLTKESTYDKKKIKLDKDNTDVTDS